MARGLSTASSKVVAKASTAKATSAKSSEKSKKEDEMPSYQAPERDFLKEGRDAITVMKEAYPALYEVQSQYNPKFAQLEAQTAATRSAAEVAGVRASGTSIRDAIRGASPEIAASGDAMLRELGNTGPSDIESELKRQALDELRNGGSLSADETRQVQQGSRAAFTARGLGNGSPAAISEVMSRASAAEGRKSQRRAFAAGVDANAQQRTASDRSYVLNANAQAVAQYDPFQRIYGSGGSTASGTVGGPTQFGNYLGASGNAAAGNQQAAVNTNQLNEQGRQYNMGVTEDSRQFEINRQDTATYTAQNREDSNRNAAAARKNATTNAVISGVGSLAMLAFML